MGEIPGGKTVTAYIYVNGGAWCGHCLRALVLGQIEYNSRGTMVCKFCRRQVRTRPRGHVKGHAAVLTRTEMGLC
jgi:hypothetical protein